MWIKEKRTLLYIDHEHASVLFKGDILTSIEIIVKDDKKTRRPNIYDGPKSNQSINQHWYKRGVGL